MVFHAKKCDGAQAKTQARQPEPNKSGRGEEESRGSSQAKEYQMYKKVKAKAGTERKTQNPVSLYT
jgi:hypothetical protein